MFSAQRPDATKHRVHEAGRLGLSSSLGGLDGLVDRGVVGNSIHEQQLRCADEQRRLDVSVERAPGTVQTTEHDRGEREPAPRNDVVDCRHERRVARMLRVQLGEIERHRFQLREAPGAPGDVLRNEIAGRRGNGHRLPIENAGVPPVKERPAGAEVRPNGRGSTPCPPAPRTLFLHAFRGAEATVLARSPQLVI
jgi:hypothetical protein